MLKLSCERELNVVAKNNVEDKKISQKRSGIAHDRGEEETKWDTREVSIGRRVGREDRREERREKRIKEKEET